MINKMLALYIIAFFPIRALAMEDTITKAVYLQMQTHPLRKELNDINKRLAGLPEPRINYEKSQAFKMHQEEITRALDEVVQLASDIRANVNPQPQKALTEAEKRFNQAKSELEHLKKSINHTITCIKQSQARL